MWGVGTTATSEGAGLLCPGERCSFQWDTVVSLEGGEVSGVPTEQIPVGR